MVRIALLGFAAVDAEELERQARMLGAELTHAEPGGVAEQDALDLVIARGVDVRKLTSHPSFLWVEPPLDAYVATGAAFSNACSFDGYLTAGARAARLFQHLLVSLDRPLSEPVLEAAPVSAGLKALPLLQAARRATFEPHLDAEIDVVMRTGGRDLAVVRRAVASLAGQSVGRIRLILVRHGPVDLSSIAPEGRLAEVEVVEAPGANRGRALAAGLAAVRAPRFAILDDDDFLLRDHFAGLLTAAVRDRATNPFAYADVLRWDQASGSTTLLLEGAASGPLTAILERLPSHAFLASSAALSGVRTAHWDMATAEDSLLIAALLRRSTPAYAPQATAVYSQGAAGSDFGHHPQRRADELALHAETFAWRAEIEARFLVAAPDPLEFLRPALRRWEAEAEGRAHGQVLPARAEPLAEVVLTGSAFQLGAFGGDEALFVRVPLAPSRTTGANLYFEPVPGGVQVGVQQPWEVGLRIDVSDYALPGCPLWGVALLKGEGPACALGVVDPSDALIERTLVPDTAARLAVEVHGPRQGTAPAIIVQAGADGAAFLRVAELRLGYSIEAAAHALGLSRDAGPDAVAAALLQRFTRQVDGAPPAPPARVASLLDENDASPFRNALKEGGERGVVGSTGVKAWDYFAQAKVPPAPAAGEWLRLRLGPVGEGFSTFLVDAAFTDRLSRVVQVRDDKAEAEIWFEAPQAEAWLVLQSGPEPRESPVRITALDRVF